MGGLHEPHARVDAVGRGRRAARRELLLGRLQHLPRVVLVGPASSDVRQVADLLGRRRERRPAPLPRPLRPPLALLLALHQRADEGRRPLRAVLQRTPTEEAQVPALPRAARNHDLDTPPNLLTP